jgi:WD40 repeat protein
MPGIHEFTKRVADGAQKPWLRPLQPALRPPRTVLIRTLEGHSDWVESLAVSGDRRRAISASRDGTLRVWDVDRGRLLRNFDGHCGLVYGVAISRNGERAISASADKTLKFWEVETGRELCTLRGHAGWVADVAMDAEGTRAISMPADEEMLKVWDLKIGRELHALKDSRAVSIAISANGRFGASVSADGTLRVWDLSNGLELRSIPTNHSKAVRSVAMTADGGLAVSGSYDGTLKLWDLKSGSEMRALQGHSEPVRGVAVSADGRVAVSASQDRTLKVWDLVTGQERLALVGHESSVNAVAMTPDGELAVSASDDATLKVWNLAVGSDRDTAVSQSPGLELLAASPNGRLIVSASRIGTDDYQYSLKVWDLQGGKEPRAFKGLPRVKSVVIDTGEHRAMLACAPATLKVLDLETGQELLSLDGAALAADDFDGTAVTADGRMAVSASIECDNWAAGAEYDFRLGSDFTLKVWDIASGVVLRSLIGHRGWIYGVAVSADGRRAMSASTDETLRVWELQSGRELHCLKGDANRVTSIVLNSDGRRAISRSKDGHLNIWDVEEGRQLYSLKRSALSLAISPDGQLAASTLGRSIELWETKCGRLIAAFTCDWVTRCCAFINNHDLVVGDAGGHVHFLRLEKPKPKP